jgi:hypothetical protein
MTSIEANLILVECDLKRDKTKHVQTTCLTASAKRCTFVEKESSKKHAEQQGHHRQ